MALVYSTQDGRLCPGCNQPVDNCTCKQGSAPEGDGVIRVQKEKKGAGFSKDKTKPKKKSEKTK